MPRGTRLTDHEKGEILAHASHGMSQREIAEEVGRSRDAVSRFLAKSLFHLQKEWKSRNQKLSRVAVRRIIREASQTKKSAEEIKNNLYLEVSTRRIQQILQTTPHLQYKQSISTPYLLARQKNARLAWTRTHLDWGQSIGKK